MVALSKRLSPLLLVVAIAALLSGCGGKKVTRVEVDTTIDLSGRWNDTDSRLVAEEMIADCLSHPWITDHMQRTGGKKPAVIVGNVRNLGTEHIATGTFLSDIERAFINSGRVRVVATREERADLRLERADQWENASDETVKRLGAELGADYMLSGTINMITDKEKGTKVVYYQVDLTLLNIETNEKVWVGQKKIKKVISRGHFKP